MVMVPLRAALSFEELDHVFRLKHGDPATTGWRPRMSHQAGYFTPDDHYEALVNRLVTPGTRWLDVGCGRDLFPSNPELARQLSRRCAELVGVDPDANVEENPFLHRAVRAPIERFTDAVGFDLITLRMVAEHISQPEAAVAHLARLCRPGGAVVIYTVNAWSPLPLASWIIPFGLHHPVKKLLWGTEERDTFPVVYRMNTRRRLARLFAAAGLNEVLFHYLADCRTFARFRWLHRLELGLWRCCVWGGLRYPELCLLGVYRDTREG
jgi:2-polyprenyl-3-methyl-5-hydroxy-6-metoxy-1,4-benzoquinol methylase